MRLHEYVKSQLSKLTKNSDGRITGDSNKEWMVLSNTTTAPHHDLSPKKATVAVSRRKNRAQKEGSFEATLSDVDKFLQENFNTLYAEPGSGRDDKGAIYDEVDDDVWSNGSFKYDDEVLPASLLPSSHRFFGASPGDSSSLMAEAHLGVNDDGDLNEGDGDGDGGGGWSSDIPEESTAVIAFTKDPYKDFRKSMEDMVRAKGFHDASQPLDWDFMEDLLMCFLELNDRKVHEHIICAFCDLTVSIRRRYSNGRLIRILKNK